jgi:hypothetical protein
MAAQDKIRLIGWLREGPPRGGPSYWRPTAGRQAPPRQAGGPQATGWRAPKARLAESSGFDAPNPGD